jgi:hypothetical protein
VTDFADKLIAELDAATCWPLPREEAHVRLLAERRAIRRGDKPRLRHMMNWDRFTDNGIARDLLVDPLGKLISKSFADFLFGEDPTFVSAEAQDDLDHAIDDNGIPAGLHRAERTCSSEGEVLWKLHVNREIADVALVDWVSRRHAVPLLYGSRMLAVAFVSEVGRAQTAAGDDDKQTVDVVWRHAEVHTRGRVVNLLYHGGNEELGVRVPLTDSAATADLVRPGEDATADGSEWPHGLPMLAGRIINDVDEDDGLGESDYDQVKDLLLALNEAVTIAAENARLTGQDRVYVASKLTRQDGSFDPSMTVFQTESDGGTLGDGDGKPPVVAMEKHYEAEPLWLHISKLTALILTRVGLVMQWIGENVDGRAESGTAVRLRFLPTVNTATAKARPWDQTLPHLLDLILQVGALSDQDGGFGRAYTATDPPSVERAEPLPADEGEVITRNATAVAAEIRSRYTAIAEQHDDWSPEQILEELARIQADTSIGGPPPPPNGVEQQVRSEHPDWTPEQVSAEVARRTQAPPVPVPA